MPESYTSDVRLLREQTNFLARNYNILDFPNGLRSMLSQVFRDVDFSAYTKVMLHQHLNNCLVHNYNGEMALKYQLFRRASRKNLVGAFETRVQNSRVDFLTVNGVSASFEIKSELDNLEKLSKQATSYERVFEYNYVVVDSRHKKKAVVKLPSSFGILRFENGNRIVERPATHNTSIDPDTQLDMLTKKELMTWFDRNCCTEIRNRISDEKINQQFKEALRSRYRTRWNFLVRHRQDILPVDLQFFFNRNIEPGLIYLNG